MTAWCAPAGGACKMQRFGRALAWPKSARAKSVAGRRSGNARFAQRLRGILPPTGWRGECVRAFSPGTRVIRIAASVAGTFTWPSRHAVARADARGGAGSKLLCSVAGFSLQPRRAASHGECSIGDALTMIPPVTGNGMSMAFEAAGMAIEPLASYSRGEMDWPRAQEMIMRTCDAAFAQRLSAARWLQWMMFAPLLRTGIGSLVLRSDCLWRILFARTR